MGLQSGALKTSGRGLIWETTLAAHTGRYASGAYFLSVELKFRENTLAESKTQSRPAVHLKMWMKTLAAFTNMATF